MEWNEGLAVGIRELDEQHKNLIEAANVIESTVASRDRWYSIHAAMVRLSEAARIHFAVEECLMSIFGYPKLEEHHTEHQRFTEKLKSLQNESLHARVSDEMAQFSKDWLQDHIVGMDRAMAEYFTSARTKAADGISRKRIRSTG